MRAVHDDNPVLEDRGVDYQVLDVTEDAAALDTVQHLGYLAAPVIVAGAEHWAGFQPDKLQQLN